MSEKRKISSFKKFSEIKKTEKKVQEVDPSINLSGNKDSDIPMNPNTPQDNVTKKPRMASREEIIPQKQELEGGEAHKFETEEGDEVEVKGVDSADNDNPTNESKKKNVKKYGRVAKFPNNTKASKAYNFLENVKVSKKSIWYIMVEKMDNELQMVKYNYKEGVKLSDFINELKTYYLNKYKDNSAVCEKVKNIKVDGNDKYSRILNIPPLELEGKKMITRITEDLIKLLSK